MNARIYCRVSTTEQAEEGFSIAQQRRACRQFCRSQGWDIADEYTDEGFSAKDTDRPALQRLLEDVEQNDIVVVWRLDRLTRSVLDLHQLMQRLQHDGALFRSVTEPYDTTTAIGRLFVTLVAALAQWERENLGERVREGMTEMVRQGKWHGGPRPYGYRPENGTLKLVPEEAAIVKEIFKRYSSGEGTITLATYLNDRGLHTTNGNRWTQFALSYLLRNPIYTGRMGFRKVKPQGTRKIRTPENTVYSKKVFEELVSDELFERVQELMEHRKIGKVRTRGNIYPLSGVLYCGKCGGRMSGRSQKDKARKTPIRRFYYACQNRFRLRTCDMPMMNQERIEHAFLSALEYATSSEELTAALDTSAPETETQNLEALRQEMRVLARRKARWYDAFEGGAIDVETLKERTAALVFREAEIQKELGELERETPEVDIEGILSRVSSLPQVWRDMEPTERKVWVHELFTRITVNESGTVDIEF